MRRAHNSAIRPIAECIRNACLPAASLFLSLNPGAVLAGPEGGQVVGGQGNISTPNATSTVINQQSQNLAIDWTSFNVSANELVQFNQPSSTASALNRIYDQNASQIFGTINANGNVLLVNPNGVFFSPTASINVNSLVASGLDISTSDFMDGKLNFFGVDGKDGIVVNQGLLQAATGGSVNLIGKAVSNEGVILATAGQVNLVAGNQVTIDFDGDGLMQFAVDKEVLTNAQSLDAAVSNTGEINADGGSVLLKGSAAKDVFSKVVNNEGIIKAGRIENKGGVIRLIGMGAGSSVLNTGTLNVSGTNGDGGTIKLQSEDTTIVAGNSVIDASSSDANGGNVQILGDKVGVFDNSTIDASGGTGGGEVLVGGDYQGKNPDIQNASITYVGGDTSINADAITEGDGGKVIVWADDTTRYYGDTSARGGSESGDGGFAEVSGKAYLDFLGVVDLTASNGEIGTLLLDPDSITIVAGAANADINGDGTFGDDITALTDLDDNLLDFPGQDSIISSAALEILLNGASVILDATTFITVNDAITQATAGTLTLESATIFINSAIDLGGAGSLVVQGDGGGAATAINLNASVTTGTTQTYIGPVNVGGAVTLTASGVDINGDVTISGGNTLVAPSGTMTVSGDWTNTAGTFTPGTGTVTFDGTGTQQLTSGGSAFNNLTVNGTGNTVELQDALTVNSVLTISAGTLSALANDINLTGSGTPFVIVDTFNAGTGTVTYSGGAAFNIATVGYNNLTINSASTGSLTGNTTVGGDLSITSGTLDAGASQNINVAGNWTNSGTFNGGTGTSTVTFDGTGTQLLTSGTGSFNNLTVNGTGNTVELQDALTVDSVLTLTAGTLSALANDINLTGSGTPFVIVDTFNAGTGTVTYSGGAAFNIATVGYNNLTINSASTGSLTGNTTVGGDLSITSGTLDAGASQNINVAGNWANSGTFTAGSGTSTVIFDGTGTQDVTSGGSAFLTLNANKTAGDLNFLDTVTITTLSTLGNAFNIAFNAGGTVTDAVTFTNTSTVTLGDDAADTIIFDGGVDTTAATTTSIAGTINTSNDAIVFGAVTLGGAVDIDTGAGGGNITFDSTVDGASTLNLDAGTGNVFITGIAGGGTALTSLTVTASANTDLNNVTTTGSQAYTSGDIDLMGTDYTTTIGGDITFTGPVTLFNDVTVNTDGAADGNVQFGGLIDADVAGNNRELTVTAGTGTATFDGNIGAGPDLADLDVTAATININATTFTIDENSVDNTITFTGAVVLGSNLVIDTNGGTDDSIVFSGAGSTIDGAFTLDLNTGTGDVTVGGVVGGIAPLTSFTSTNAGSTLTTLNDINTSTGVIDISSTTINLTGSDYLSDDGDIDFAGAVNLNVAGLVTIDSNADNDATDGAITFTGAINDNVAGDSALTIDADTDDVSFNAIGTGTRIGALTVTGNDIDFQNNVETQGAIVVTAIQGGDADSITVGAFTLDANGGAITFASDDMVIDSNALLISTGAAAGVDITFQGETDATTIGVAGGTGTLQLLEADLQNVSSDFTDIIIGSATQTGLIDVENMTLNNTGLQINIESSGTTEFTLDGALNITNDGSAFSVVGTGVSDLGANINTDSGTVDFDGNVIISADDVTIKTDNNVVAGAAITFDGAIDADDDDAPDRALILNAGTGGTVTVSGNIGENEAFDDTTDGVTITGGDISLQNVTTSAFTAGGHNQDSGDVNITGNGIITIGAIDSSDRDDRNAGDVTITNLSATGGDNITISGDIDASSGTTNNSTGGVVTIDASGSNTISLRGIDVSGEDFAAPGDVILLNTGGGTGAITLEGDLNTSVVGAGEDGGNIVIGTDLILGADITGGDDVDMTTTAPGTDGNITFNGTVDSDTGIEGLTVDLDTGDIVFAGDVGAGTSLGAVTVTDAHDVTFEGAFDANTFTQLAGSGTTTLGGTAGAAGNFTTSQAAAGQGIHIITSLIQINDDVSSANSITLDATTTTVSDLNMTNLNATFDLTAGDDGNQPGAFVRDVTAVTDINIVGDVTLEDRLDNADNTVAANRFITRMVATGGSYLQPGGGDTTTIETALDNSIWSQVRQGLALLSCGGGACFIGDDSTAGAITITDADLLFALQTSIGIVTIDALAGNVVLDMAVAFNDIVVGDGLLVINNVTTVDDNTGDVLDGNGLAFVSTLGLAITSTGAVGLANVLAEDGGAGDSALTLDVGSLTINGTGGNAVTVINLGTTDTTYDIATGGAGDITVTQTASNLIIGTTGISTDTTGTVTLTASNGSIIGDVAGTIVGGNIALASNGDIGSTGTHVLLDYDDTAGTISFDTTQNAGTGDIYVDETNGALQVTDLTVTTDGATTQIVQIGNTSGAISVDVASNFANDDVTLATTGVTQDINFTANSNTLLSTGNITLDATGAIVGAATGGTAEVSAATVTLNAALGGVGTTTNRIEVTATTALNADTTIDGSDIFINSIGDLPLGLVDAGTGTVTLTSPGNITAASDDGIADVAGGTINLIAAIGGIGGGAAVDVTATTVLNADTVTGDDGAISIDSIGNLAVGLVDAGIGSVTLDSTGNITATDDGTADVVGSTVSLVAAAGGVGVIDVTATTALNADTTADGGNILVDSIGSLLVGLVDAAAGDVTLNSTTTINDATADTVVDIIGGIITLDATAGGIGTTEVLEVTAGTQLDASTATDNGNILIGSVGALPVGLVTTGSNTLGTVTLTSTTTIDDHIADTVTVDIQAGTLNLTAGGAIGGTEPLELDVTLIPTVTSTGTVALNSITALLVPTYTDITTNGGDVVLNAPDGMIINGAVDTTNAGAGAGSVTINSDFEAVPDGIGAFTLAATGSILTNDGGTDGDFNLTVGGLPLFVGGSTVDIGTGTFTFAFSTGNSLCLGDALGCDNILPDSTIDTFVLLGSGSLGLTANTFIEAEAVTVLGDLALTAGTTIDDVDDLIDGFTVGISTTGTLTLTSGGAIGGASADADAFTVDAANVVVTSTGGNDITVTDAGATDTTYDIATGGAGTVDVSKGTNNLVVGNITTTGSVDLFAGNGSITDFDTADDSIANIVAGTNVNVAASTSIGATGLADLDITVGGQLDALSIGDIFIESTGNMALGQVTSLTSNVTLTSGGNITDALVDAAADVQGATINLNTTGGTIGTGAAPVDVTALTALNASTVGGNIFVDSIGNLPIGLIDAGAGNVTLVSSGDITQNDSGTIDIVGTNLDISTTGAAGIGVGVGGWIDTDVTNLTASVSGTGEQIFIWERDTFTADGLTLNGNVTTNGGTIDLRLVGDFSDGGNTIETQDVNETSNSGQISIRSFSAGEDILLTGVINSSGIDRTLVDGAGFAAGNVLIQAGGNIDASAATIDAIGGDARDTFFDFAAFFGGGGNIVQLFSINGLVSAGTIDTSGGAAASSVGDGTASGGIGASILITSNGASDVILNSTLTTLGGAGTNNGLVDNTLDGMGGTVTINSAANVRDDNDPGGTYAANLDISARNLNITAVGEVGGDSLGVNAAIDDFATGVGNALEIAVGNNVTVSTSVANGDINLDVGTNTPLGTLALDPGGIGNIAEAIVQSTTGALTVNTGAFTTNAGDGIGFIASTILTIPDESGPINVPSVNLLLIGGTDVVDAGGGDLNNRTLSITAGDLSFTSGGAGLTTLNTTIGSLVANLTTASASLTVNETDAIVLTDIDTNNGDFTVFSTLGSITVVDIDTALTAAASTATVSLETGVGSIIDGGDAVTDGITAQSLDLRARTGIAADSDGGGSTVDDVLELDVTNLAATTTTGDINIQDTAGGVNVTTVLASTGITTSTGDISLTALGATSDIVIGSATANAIIQNTTGDIDINAGHSVIFTPGAGFRSFVYNSGVAATGTVTILANSDAGASGGAIDMSTCTGFQCFVGSEHGKTNLTTAAGVAGGDINIQLAYAANNTASDAIIINSSGAINAVTYTGFESIYAPNGGVDIDAVSGVGSGSAITSRTATLDVKNSGTSGNIAIAEVDGTTVAALQQTNAANTAGTVTLTSTTGNIGLNDGSVISQGGLITLTATAGAITDADGGTNVSITNNDTTGEASLTAADGIGDVDAIETTIGILTASNTSTNSIGIDETTDLALNTVANGTLNVFINSGGAITDNNGAGVLNITAQNLILKAVTGIGDTTNAIDTLVTFIAAETDTGDIAVLESAAGTHLQIISLTSTHTGTVNGADITTGAVGDDIDIRTTDGILQIEEAVDSNGGGTVTLIADGMNQRLSFFLNGSVTSSGGDITLTSDDNIQFFTNTISIASNDGNILLTANADDANGTGGDGITMLNGNIINSGLGTITLDNNIGAGTDGGNIILGQLISTNGTTSAITIDTDAAVTDTLDAGAVDIIATTGGVVITAGVGGVTGGVGSGDAIETTVFSVDITNSTAGTIEITETDDLALVTVDNGTRDVVLNVAGGAIVDGGDNNLFDIVAGNVTLTASTGIGAVGTAVDADGGGVPADDALEMNISGLSVTNTTNALQIENAGSLIITDTINNGTNAVSITVGGALIDGGDDNELVPGGADIVAGALTLISDTGVGAVGTRDLTADGDVPMDDALETTITSIDATNSTSGAIQIDELDALTVTNATQTVDAEANDVIITAGGNISVTNIDAGPTAGDVKLQTTAAIIDLSDAPGDDVTGQDVQLIAGTGISNGAGADDRLGINAVNLAATTATGNIDIEDTVGGVTVTTVNVTGAASTSGVQITAGSATADNIDLLATGGSLNIFSDVINNNDGNITLAATGINSDILIGDGANTGRIQSHAPTSTTSTINITADDSILFGINSWVIDGSVPNYQVDINLTANNDDTGSGDTGSVIDMTANCTAGADCFGVFGQGLGKVSLSTVGVNGGDITLSQVATGLVNANTAADAITINSGGAVIDGQDASVVIAANENIYVRDIFNTNSVSGGVIITAVTGVGSGNAIETNVASASITNSTSGAIEIFETDGLLITNATNTTAGAINITTAGATTIVAAGGGVTTGDASTVNVTVNGGASLTVDDVVSSQGGAVTLSADDDISFAVAGDVSSNNGNILITADDDITVDAGFGGAIVMADGAVIDAGSGTIGLSADENITLGGVTTTNATITAVTISSASGGVVDGGDADVDVVAANGGVLINAVTGVGSGGFALETTVASADITNATLGTIEIAETDGLIVTNAAQATNSDANDVTITSTTGDIDVIVIDAGTLGDVILTAAAGAVDGVAAGTHITADDLTIDATTGIGATVALNTSGVNLLDTDTTNGNIDINNVTIASTNVLSMSTGTGTINYDQTGDQLLTLTTVTATDGDVTLTNAGVGNDDILIGLVTADTVDDVVTITSTGGAIDDLSANPDLVTDITGFNIALNAAEGIGATAHVDLGLVSTLSADSTAGAINLNLDSSAAVAVTSLTTTAAPITFQHIIPNTTVGAGTVTFTTVTTTGANDINLLAFDGITVDGAVSTGGNISINADADGFIDTDGTLTMTAASATTGGNLQLSAFDFNLLGTLTVGGLFNLVFTEGIGGLLCLGSATTGCGSTLNNTTLATMASAGSYSIDTGGFGILADDADLAGVTSASFTGTTFNDENVSATGNGIYNAGSLTITTTGAVGGASAGADGLTIDNIGTLNITSTGGNAVTLTNQGTGSTAYGIATGGAGNVTLTQTANSILLNSISTTGNVNLTAAAGAITDNNAATSNIVANVLTMVADTGIGSADALETTVTSINAVNNTSGAIRIAETDGLSITQATNTTAGAINITTAGATTILAGGGVTTGDASTVNVTVNGGASLTVNDVVSSQGGAVTLSADDDINFAVAGDVSSNNGNILIRADDDGTADASMGGAIVMLNGTLIDAGSGTIGLSADENITLGGVTTTNATTAAVTISSASGGVVDGGGAHVDVVAAGRLVVNAATGVGSAGALDTSVESVNINNTTSGNIDLINTATGAVNIINITNLAAGTIGFAQAGNQQLTITNIDAVNGNVTVSNAGGAGANILIGDIDADTVDDVVTITSTGGAIDDLSANPDLVTDITGSQINLNATQGIGATAHVDLAASAISAVTTTGDIALNNSATTAVTVSNLTTSAGAITFNQTGNQSLTFSSAVTTGNGDITLSNTGGTGADISIGTVTADTTNDNIIINAAGAISSTGTITGNTLTMSTGSGGIGSIVAPIDTNITGTFNLTTNSGDIFISDANAQQTSNFTLATGAGIQTVGLTSAGALTVDSDAYGGDDLILTGTSINTTSAVTTANSLTLNGNSTIANTINIIGGLIVNGTTTQTAGTITTVGNIALNGNTALSGDVTSTAGGLTVTGTTTQTAGTITTAGNISLNGDAVLAGNATSIGGNFIVNGTSSLGGTYIAIGTIGLNGDITLTNNTILTAGTAANLIGAVTGGANNLMVSSPTTRIIGDVTTTGIVDVNAGTLILNGDILASVVDLAGTGTLSLQGDALLSVTTDIIFPATVTGDFVLAIDPADGAALVIGAANGGGAIPVSSFSNFSGDLVIGGFLTTGGALTADFGTADFIDVSAFSIDVNTAFETNGSITLLAGQLALNANITAGAAGGDGIGAGPDVVNFTAVGGGSTATTGASGNIEVPGLITVSAEEGVFVAQGDFNTPTNVILNFAGGSVEVATASGGVISFGPGSNATGQPAATPGFSSYLSLLGLAFANFNANVSLVQILNPAADLIGLEELGFIDTGLFELDLTLFGVIGDGIALALAQCEEIEGCAPNVTEEELNNFIEQIGARLEELLRRVSEATNAAEKEKLEKLIAGYQEELGKFIEYRKELQAYLTVEEDEDFEDEDFEEDFDDTPAPATSAINKLSRTLEGVNARIQWLESLRDNPEERARLGQLTGIELTQEALEAIIEGAKSEAKFIEKQLNLLQNGTEAMHQPDPLFIAMVGDQRLIRSVNYGPSLLNLGGENMQQAWY